VRQVFSITICVLVGFLASCTVPVQGPESVDQQGGVAAPTISVIDQSELTTVTSAFNDRQFLADLLYEALQALDNDRLLTPIDDNAYRRFQRVLAYEPDNELALQGLKDIVQRYLQLAEQSMRRGLFEEAESFLDNARFVDADDQGIAGVSLALQAEMNSGDLFFNLDNREFAARSDEAKARLEDIAKQAQLSNAFFLIVAPNDELARWMFGIMRDAVSGYRLRGNIELASQTSIRLRMPRSVE
jgi:tetratricopeptide (TPR) repeat protein